MNARQAISRNDIIYVQSTGESGLNAYYYLKLRQPRYKLEHALKKSTEINLNEYGEILEMGFGKTPSLESAEKMKRLYNYVASVVPVSA